MCKNNNILTGIIFRLANVEACTPSCNRQPLCGWADGTFKNYIFKFQIKVSSFVLKQVSLTLNPHCCGRGCKWKRSDGAYIVAIFKKKAKRKPGRRAPTGVRPIWWSASIFGLNARAGHRNHYHLVCELGAVVFTLALEQHHHGHLHLHRVVVITLLPVEHAAAVLALGHEDFTGMPGVIGVVPGRRQRAQQISCQL